MFAGGAIRVPGNKRMTYYLYKVSQHATDMREKGLSFTQIAEGLGIRKAARIKDWYRSYRQDGELAVRKPIERHREIFTPPA